MVGREDFPSQPYPETDMILWEALHEKSHRQRNRNPAPAQPLPWLPANRGSRPHAQQRPGPLAPPLGPDPARSDAPPLPPQKRHMVHDLTKNVTELYKADGTIATSYDYTQYGSVTASGIDQTIQGSSEHYDPELALVYYNYRYYTPAGRALYGCRLSPLLAWPRYWWCFRQARIIGRCGR